MYYVYALVDPINRLPFYIGKGTKNRMNAHLLGYDRSNVDKVRMIENIRNLGFEPQAVKILDNIEDEIEAYKTETLYINEIRSWGTIKLTNKSGLKRPPSRLGHKWSKESIDKRSRTIIESGSRKNVRMSEEQKAKISKTLKGRPSLRKVNVDMNLLKKLRSDGKTKSQIIEDMGIGMGTLNRALAELKSNSV